jgi:hypothetical protein
MTYSPKILPAFKQGVSKEAQNQHQVIYFWVGQYVVAWATTESTFIGLYHKILETSNDNAALLYYSNQSNYGKGKALQNFAKANLPEEQAKEFSALIKRFKAFTTLRNELVHSEYSMDIETKLYYQTVTANLDVYAGGDPCIRTPIDNKWINRIKTMSKSLSVLNHDIWQFIQNTGQPSKPPTEPQATNP